jgi:DNA-binding transcriptional LysR family regulator
LSKQLKNLEEEPGFSIFARDTNGVIPTVKSEEFLIYANNLVDECSHILELENGIVLPKKRRPVG